MSVNECCVTNTGQAASDTGCRDLDLHKHLPPLGTPNFVACVARHSPTIHSPIARVHAGRAWGFQTRQST